MSRFAWLLVLVPLVLVPLVLADSSQAQRNANRKHGVSIEVVLANDFDIDARQQMIDTLSLVGADSVRVRSSRGLQTELDRHG